ncbi:MAG: hypothetical protein JW818_06235 [Pirellulales bacterium]|nr:hypothetical protein [Pirellulales bacterium]
MDGKPVRRASGRIVTLVPFALVPQGKRELTLQRKPHADKSKPETLKLTATLEAGKRYRFAYQNGDVVLIEEVNKR